MTSTQKLVSVCIATLVSAILIGAIVPWFIYNQFHLFGSFSFSPFFVALASVVLLGLVLDFLIKPSFALLSTLCLCLFLCTVTMTSTFVLEVAERKAIHLAENMIQEINKYQQEHGYYPANINLLRKDIPDLDKFKKSLSYALLKDSTFELVAWNDGWYDYIYYSRDKSWQKTD